MDLKEKIESKKAKVAVIGLGYVGLPQALEIAKAGLSVLGIDLDKNKIERIQNNKSYISDIKGDIINDFRSLNDLPFKCKI